MDLRGQIEEINKEPGIVVIAPTTDPEKLEKEYIEYSSLPVDQMLMSDDKAIEVYGKTNQDMYNCIKTIINNSTINEGFSTNDEIDLKDFDKVVIDAVHHPSKETIANIDQAIKDNKEKDLDVVIFPYTDYYKYSLEELEKMWDKYCYLPMEHKTCSNAGSIKLFGQDVEYMYHTNKNILLSIMDKKDQETKTKKIFEAYHIKENRLDASEDRLTMAREKLNCLASTKNNLTFAYHALSEECIENIDKKIDEMDDIGYNIPEFVPMLTPTDIEDYFEDDGLSKEVMTFLEEYKKALAVGLCEFDGEAYKENIEKLFDQKQKANQTDTIHIDNLLALFGWNPNMKPTPKSWDFARNRLHKYINENYSVRIIDARNLTTISEADYADSPLYPVYIVLSYTGSTIGKIINAVKNSTYSHACIAFDETMHLLYTYASGGFQFEDFNKYLSESKDSICKIMVTFVDKSQISKIKSNLEYYIQNRNKSTYAINNLFNILFNRKIKDKYSLNQVCSQFVNQLLTLGNVNIFTGKSNNLISPDDFDKVKSPKLYTVYEGRIADYRPEKIKATVQGLMMKNVGMKTKKYKIKEAANIISTTNSIEYLRLVECEESETRANEILAEIHDLITPESVLVEAKSLPFRISSKGVIIDLPIRLEEEYQEVHKTLQVYEKEGSIEQMKPELARLWYLNLVAERKIKVKTRHGKQEDAKKIRDVRARIMNDFKKYLSMVLKNEPEFDFATYFDKSKYNDRKLFVDKETLAYSGKAIATVVKHILK